MQRRSVLRARLLALSIAMSVAAGVAAAPATALDEVCVGDCDLDRRVGIIDLITAVRVVLGAAPLTACPSIVCDQDAPTAVDCLVTAIDHALHGDCDVAGLPCGTVFCGTGEYCCNALFNICAPLGQACIQ
jgi:hypothetical protein